MLGFGQIRGRRAAAQEALRESMHRLSRLDEKAGQMKKHKTRLDASVRRNGFAAHVEASFRGGRPT